MSTDKTPTDDWVDATVRNIQGLTAAIRDFAEGVKTELPALAAALHKITESVTDAKDRR